MLLVVFLAAAFRLWQLGEIPAGFYRDEAFNGLDAAAVLAGENTNENPFFFEANNGREPAYIYLTTIAVALFGQTVQAVRLTAAVVGTLTTLLVYLLAKSWFNQRVGLLTALMWAMTVWPIHLSRIGLRPILMPFMMALLFWVGTMAYKQSRPGKAAVRLWLLSGIIYGLSFYTYLAVRFTPLLLLLFLLYLYLTGRKARLWPGLLWFVIGTIITTIPLILLGIQQPETILGRPGQVSIFNPDIIGGATPLTVFLQQSWRALGLFFIKGDTILRHNPAGRPLFDWLMAAPFFVGLWWSLHRWRQPAVMALLLWTLIMLGPTILAEDAPHFLRAVGLLPAALFFPALGLAHLWLWLKLSPFVKGILIAGLLAGSLFFTVNDYFLEYGRQPETGYWFENSARKLAENINTYEVSQTDLFLDQRYWDGWPTVRFLVNPEQKVTLIRPEDVQPNQFETPSVVYIWPYDGLNQAAKGFGPGLLTATSGEDAQGDFDPAPYPFYNRYELDPTSDWPVLANFDNSIQLRQASVLESEHQHALIINLFWSVTETIENPYIVFVHLIGPDGIITQSDTVPAQGLWPTQWWRPGVIVNDQHVLDLEAGFDPANHQIIVGFYHADTKDRLTVFSADGTSVGDTWPLQP